MTFFSSRARLATLASLITLASFVPLASATLLVALDLRELTQQADVVVIARVAEQAPRWDERHRIVTDVSLVVEEVVKGDVTPGETLPLVRMGGAIDDLAMRIEGEPSFTSGERVMVFGKWMNGFLRPVGMSQGVLAVTQHGTTTMVEPGGGGALLVRPNARGALVPAPGALTEPRPMAAFVREVRALAEQNRVR